MKNKTMKNGAARKIISFAWLSTVFTMLFTVTASAEGKGVQGIKDWILSIAKDLKVIGYAVGVLAVIVLAIIIIAGGSGGLQKGKAIAVPILVGVAVLSFGTGILGSLAGSDNVTEVAYDTSVNMNIGDAADPYEVSVVDFT